jgi:hypothetical protein
VIRGSTGAAARSLIDARLRSVIYLDRERAELLRRLGEIEALLDVEPAGLGFGKPGLLAVTDSRVIHLYGRRILRRFAVREVLCGQVTAVEVEHWGTTAEIRLLFEDVQRGRGGITLYPRLLFLPISSGPQRASELAQAIRDAAGLAPAAA